MRRQGTFTRPTFTIAAPAGGGGILLFVGDPAVPRFVLPTPTNLALGNVEGQPIRGSQGMVLMRFRHAGDIGAVIAEQRFGRIEILARHDRPELVAFRRQHEPTMPGAVALLTAAEIEFRLADGRRGAMTLVTSGSDLPGLGGNWGVDEIYGFVAPPEAAGLAGAALGRVLGSFRVNPQWFAAEQRGQRIDGERYLAYLHRSAELQQRMLEQRWAAQDRVAAARGDLLSGTVRLVDPRTGEVFQARAGSRYFYRALPETGARPAIVGVDVDFNPEPQIEMRRMLQMGVDIPYR